MAPNTTAAQLTPHQQELLASATLKDPELAAHANDFYAAMRLGDPVHFDPVLGSWLVYAIAYGLFARATTWGTFWALLPLYAIHYGLGEGAEKSLMARACAPHERGTAFGAQNAVHGIALLPANVVFGVLYAKRPSLAFGVSSALALTAFAYSAILDRVL